VQAVSSDGSSAWRKCTCNIQHNRKTGSCL
jgi:hypothetical protein